MLFFIPLNSQQSYQKIKEPLKEENKLNIPPKTSSSNKFCLIENRTHKATKKEREILDLISKKGIKNI